MVGGSVRWLRARAGCVGEGCIGGPADAPLRSARGRRSGRRPRTPAGASRLALALAALLPLAALRPLAAAQAEAGGGTTWVVSPSEAYDALCFLNPLLGDPFYTRFYPQDSDAFRQRLGADALAALDRIDGMRRASGTIVSAALTSLFSAADPSTLADDLALARDPARLLAAVEREGPALDEPSRQAVSAALAPLAVVLAGLRDAGFDGHWRERALPVLEQDAARLARALPGVDVVGAVEAALGTSLPGRAVTVIDAYYTQPHGIRLTGMRFIQSPGASVQETARTAVHELLHGLLARLDPGTLAALRRAGGEPFVQDHVRGHDPNYGYNTLDGYLEEDAVRALEQRVSEGLGVAAPLTARFRSTEDDGMHVLAGALYALMRQQGFRAAGGESFPAFMARMAADGRLGPGAVESLYDAFLTME